MAHRIITNIAYLLSSRIITQLLIAFSLIYLARVLGPKAFGELNISIATITYFMIIADFGLPLLGTREIAAQRTSVKFYFSNILTLRVFLALISFILVCVLVYFLRLSTHLKYLILLYAVGLFPFSMMLDWVFQGIEKMGSIAIPRVFSTALFVVLLLAFVRKPQHLLLVPCFQLIGNLMLIASQHMIFKKQFGWITFGYHTKEWKGLIKRAFPIGLTIMMGPFLLYADTMILGFLKGSEVVGYYNAACRIVITLAMLSIVYQDALFPVITNYYHTSPNLFVKMESFSTKCVVSLILPVAVGGTMLAGDIIGFLYGHYYHASVIVFRILIWSFAFEAVYHIFARGLVVSNRLNQRLKVIFWVTITNILLNFLLIPSMSLKGAAIATVFSRALGLVLFYFHFRDMLSPAIYSYLVRPLIATLVMAISLHILLHVGSLAALPLVSIGMGVYVISFIMIKGFNRDDVYLLTRLLTDRSKTTHD
ncbi:MAG: flippase [Deltaproteobacteria bacterium]|nr:flippase [Deltaproteobacteria bacterium]